MQQWILQVGKPDTCTRSIQNKGWFIEGASGPSTLIETVLPWRSNFQGLTSPLGNLRRCTVDQEILGGTRLSAVFEIR